MIDSDVIDSRRKRASLLKGAAAVVLAVAVAGAGIGRLPAQDAAESRPASRPDSSPVVRDVSTELAAIVSKRKVPGLVALRLDGRDVSARGVAGVRRRGSSDPLLMDDRFHLGSCTKAMTAAVCAELVESGVLRFESTLGDVCGDAAGPAGGAWRKIPLDALLSNVGGVPGDLSPRGVWEKLWKFRGSAFDARRLLLSELVAGRSPQPCRQAYEYSNAGFSLAGHMAETATGQPFEALLDQRLFRPLGMTTAGFGAPGGKGEPAAPCGHRADGSVVLPGPDADNPVAITPAGRVHASIDDWAKFIADQLAGARGEKARLKPETYRRLHTQSGVGKESYAMGFVRTERPWGGGPVLTHSGSNTYWHCTFWIAPGKNFAVLAACNQGGPGGASATDDACALLLQHTR